MLIDKKLYQQYFEKDKKDNYINLDLGIFNHFKFMVDTGLIKQNSHRTFAFAYNWLVSYLWKYSKYTNQEINTQDIKTILGVSPQEKRVNYLIKKDGVLDKVGYTETTRDFPISTDLTGDDGIKITQLSDIDKLLADIYLKKYNSRYTCKKPLLQYHREGKEGLMYSKDDTIPISVFEFTRCVLCSEIGVDGFMIYCYLKYRSKMLGYAPVTVFNNEIVDAVGFKERKIRELIQNLELAGMIEVNRKVSKKNGAFVKSNTYKIIHKG